MKRTSLACAANADQSMLLYRHHGPRFQHLAYIHTACLSWSLYLPLGVPLASLPQLESMFPCKYGDRVQHTKLLRSASARHYCDQERLRIAGPALLISRMRNVHVQPIVIPVIIVGMTMYTSYLQESLVAMKIIQQQKDCYGPMSP